MLRSLQLEMRALPSLGAWARKIAPPAAAAAMLFLLMRAELPPETAPLATAMTGAALAAGVHPAAVFIGCLSGMLRFPLSEIRLLGAVGCVLAMLLELLSTLIPGLQARTHTRMRIAFCSGIACMLPAMVKAGGASLPSLQAFAAGALAAAGAPFMLSALELSPGRKRLTPDEKCGCALIIGGCIAGLNHILPPLAEGISVLLVLLLPGFAPASGILAGLGLCLGGGSIAKLASLALCALFSGGAMLKLRWQRALAACGAALLTQLMAGPDALDLRWALGGAAVYPLLPVPLVKYLDEIAAPSRRESCDPERIAREAMRENRRKLSALADAFSIMAECSPTGLDVPDEQELIQEMRCRLCAGCIHYANCWAGEDNRAVHLLCRLIGDALERTDAPPGMRILFSDGEVPPDVLRICRRGRMIPDRLGLLLRDFAQKRRSEIKRCENNQLLSLQLMQAGEILRAMADQPGVPSCPQRLHAALEGAGLGFCEALPLQQGAFALVKGESWSREEVRRACRALSHSLNARFSPHADGGTLHLMPAPQLRAEAAASCQSGVAGEICGDSHIVRMLDEHRLLLAISDGMGSGEAAAAESTEALRLLWSFLDAGISQTLALETVNRQLLMRSGEDIFATIDLCIIDLNSGVAEMTKLAACRTILLRGSETLRIEGGRLPLGILENVQAGGSRARLQPGDVLVMGSDGVMEAGDIAMAERFIRENAALPPDQLAEQLVRQAVLCRAGRHRDDLTCICARIDRA